MKGLQYITSDIINKTDFIWYGLDSNYKKHKVYIDGFEPYFYVPETDEISESKYIKREGGIFTNCFGYGVRQLYTRYPEDIPEIRGSFSEHFEADIPYKRRILIDKNVLSGFTFNSYNITKNEFKIHHNDIRPINIDLQPTNVIYDIECPAKNGFESIKAGNEPIIASSVYDYRYKQTITFFTEGEHEKTTKMGPNWYKISVPDEYSLLMNTKKYFENPKIDPALVSGWNIYFDTDTTTKRAKKHNIDINWKGMSKFDMLEGYKMLSNRSLGNRLKDVAVVEGFVKKEDLASDHYRDELWENPDLHPLLVQYSADDVKYPRMVDERYTMTPFFWGLKNDCGLEDIESTMYFNISIDIDRLRLIKELGYVAPSRREKQH